MGVSAKGRKAKLKGRLDIMAARAYEERSLILRILHTQTWFLNKVIA